MKTNRFWIILFTIVICVCAGIIFTMRGAFPVSGNGLTAHIYSNGHLISSVDLDDNNERISFTVWAEGEPGYGGYNVIEAERGKIRVSQSNCRDEFCIRQGWITSGVVPVVCLPNKLVIEIEEDRQNSKIDGVVG